MKLKTEGRSFMYIRDPQYPRTLVAATFHLYKSDVKTLARKSKCFTLKSRSIPVNETPLMAWIPEHYRLRLD